MNSGKKILIVEDNEKNMKLVRDILAYQGHQVLEAVTGEQGVALALSERPDLVLMDIQLPDISGVTALERLRADRALDAVPVLAVSASVMPEEQQRIVSSGFDAFVAKPISMKSFIATVNDALQNGRKGGAAPPARRRPTAWWSPTSRRTSDCWPTCWRPRASAPAPRCRVRRRWRRSARSRPTSCCSTS